MSKKFEPIQYVDDDNLEIMEVRNWAEVKYKLVGKYCNIFTSGMKNKWNLVYFDFFSGPGYSQKKDTPFILKNCAMIALSLPNKFDYYAFNDFDQKATTSLEKRIRRDHASVNYKVFNQDANQVASDMLNSIPKFNNGRGTLIFSFLDPYSANLHFSTIKTLGEHRSDILVLHPLQMDIRRNHQNYKGKENTVIGKFTGNSKWREVYGSRIDNPTELMKFATEEFDRSISQIGYKTDVTKFRVLNDLGRGIYYLCFYSKNDRGIEFWEKILKIGGNNQYEMF